MLFKMGWRWKRFFRHLKAAGYVSCWIVVLLLTLIVAARTFPFHATTEVFYVTGRLSGIFGMIFLAFVITSRNFFSRLRTVMDPVRLDRALRITEVCGLTLIFLHPLLLVAGRYLTETPNPWDIIIPNFSTYFHLYIAYGCIAFWMLFIGGIFFLNRNRVSLTGRWKYFHVLVYPAFLLSLMHSHTIGTSSSDFYIDLVMHFTYYAVSFSVIFKLVELMLRKRREVLRSRRARRTPRNEALGKTKRK